MNDLSNEDHISLEDDLWSRSIQYSVTELEACINHLKQRSNHEYDSIALKAIDDVEGRLSVVLRILSILKGFHGSTQELEKILRSR